MFGTWLIAGIFAFARGYPAPAAIVLTGQGGWSGGIWLWARDRKLLWWTFAIVGTVVGGLMVPVMALSHSL